MIATTDRLMTPEDLAGMLGISLDSVYDFAERGGGPPRIRIGRRVRFDRADVRDWLASRREQ